MNIALLSSAFYPHVGGVEELVRQLAHAYRAAGHRAIVITNKWPPPLPAYEEYEGIPTYRLSMRMPEGNLKELFRNALAQPGTKRKLITILQRHTINLIHVQCVSVNGYYALMAKHALNLPLVVTAQGERTMDAEKKYERSPLLNQVLRDLLTEAGAITACSGDTLADIETFYDNPLGSRAHVIYNGIRLLDFAASKPYSHSRPYVLGIGRLVLQKGFDVLIHAFAKANMTTHDLLIAGAGPEFAALQDQIGKLGLQSRVHLLGQADRPTAISLFQGCDWFVLPSRMEPQGIVNLEAMAAGKAVIASRVGGVPEIVLDNVTGLLVPPDNANALSIAMSSLANDCNLRVRLGTAGKAMAQSYDWNAISERYLTLYKSLSLLESDVSQVSPIDSGF